LCFHQATSITGLIVIDINSPSLLGGGL